MKKLEKIENEVKQYSKDTVLKSEKFADYKDILCVKLHDKKRYTMKELDEMVKQFTKKE